MKIGLLGGSFNPAHLGHIHISNLAIKKLGLNQIWWIPTAQNPFKEKSSYETYEERVSKCKNLSKQNHKIYVKKFDEISTAKLVTNLKNRHKKDQFFWIMGADNFERFHEWKNFENLIKNLPFIIFSREKFLKKIKNSKAFYIYKGLKKSGKKLPKFSIFYTKNLDISSSKIRKNPNV